MKSKLIKIIVFMVILALVSVVCFAFKNTENERVDVSKTVQEYKPQISIESEYIKAEEVTKVEITETGYVEEAKPKNNDLIQSLDFDANEAEMLMKIAMAEAGGEGKECMAHVMLTVLNRTWSDKFPNSIYDVIHQVYNGTYQFTPVANGAYNAAIPSDECKAALDLVMSGWNESQNALYFESCPGSSWHSRNLQFLYQCGRMKFYK